MTRKGVLFGLVLAALGFAVGLFAGRERVPATTAPATQGTTQRATYAMNVVVSGVPFWTDTRAAWEQIGRANPGVSMVFGGPADTDARRQIEEVEALIAKKVDGLVIAPADSAALAPVIDRAVSQGIPVVTYLVDSPTSKRLMYVASELETASQRIAGRVATGAAPRSKVAILYAQAGNAEQEARRRGFEQFVKARGYQLVGVYEDNYDERKGAEIVRALVSKHPDLKFIFGSNSRSAVGAVSALREARFKAGQVTISGWDTDQDVLDLIREGWVQGTVAQQSSFMTQVVFSILEANRKKYLYPLARSYKENGIRPVSEQLIIPVELVTPANVQGFYLKKAS